MKIGLTVLVIISNLLLLSQEKEENLTHFIGGHGGIQLDGNSWPTFNVEYGQSITEKINWSIGFNYLRYSGDNLMEECSLPKKCSLPDISDSLKVIFLFI